ncbi:MAG: 3-phosphoshikimate 1-carboxyvinyltransferase [Bacteroidales bacterium]|nr:3-phosphoshikimate 1-carboxyvinyltransferase [Bacteroidales bacterium]MBR4773500.1 3-phosphoshikimate 1-carboxyvinyltransferase [Bacteroidales bacterium]
MNTNDIRINLPASKSMSNRWLMINHLLGSHFRIGKLSTSGDTKLLRRLLTQLETQSSDVFYCENAGSVARFMMPLLAITNGSSLLTGDERLCQRPMAPLIDALRQMGLRLECTEKEGFLPVHIQGSVPTRRTVTVDPLLSSQFVSALLLVAPQLPEGISLTMTQRPTSRPYIEMTTDALQQAGVEVRRSSNGRTYYVQHYDGKPKPAAVTIERDWSAASYFYTMAMLRPDLRIRLLGLQLDSCQGDSATDRFFRMLGVVSTEVRSPYRAAGRSITVQGGGERAKSVVFNCIDCPDLVPTFAVAAAASGLRAVLKGVSNIALKESDRMISITTELRRMGATVNTTDDEMHILPSVLKPKEMVRTYGDHRIAMAFAPLQLRFPELKIEAPEVVEKSFPEFWEEFEKVLSVK